MQSNFAGVWVLSLLLGVVAPFGNMAQAQPATETVTQDHDLPATPELVREIQFMLLRLGLEPGPLDGLPRQRTNRAVRRFEEIHGLPLVDLESGGKVPAKFLDQLRTEAARAMFGAAGSPEAMPAAPSSPMAPAPAAGGGPPAAPATAAIVPPPPDRFAACHYDPEDFHIGPNRFTPETFLREGFDGSSARAVANLEDRLAESRQLADQIGISALREVQRQARVLQYFKCRLKVEQAAASKS